MSYEIQANASGSRSLKISEANLKTIDKYSLFGGLVDSTGVIDEEVLEKLKMNVRSLLMANEQECSDLLELCLDVIYHKDMKAFGLHKLVILYVDWRNRQLHKENSPQSEKYFG